MSDLPAPDLADRPYGFTLEIELRASPQQVFEAWVTGFDTWFADPGVIRGFAHPGEPFYFRSEHESTTHAHYGRFLTVRANELVELTWVSGKPGTEGAETLLRVEFSPSGSGTRVRLTHEGFYDEAGVRQHDAAWPAVLAALDDRIAPVVGE